MEEEQNEREEDEFDEDNWPDHDISSCVFRRIQSEKDAPIKTYGDGTYTREYTVKCREIRTWLKGGGGLRKTPTTCGKIMPERDAREHAFYVHDITMYDIQSSSGGSEAGGCCPREFFKPRNENPGLLDAYMEAAAK